MLGNNWSTCALLKFIFKLKRSYVATCRIEIVGLNERLNMYN